MRFTFDGGVYGREFTLQLITAEGDSITLTGNEAFNLHTEIFKHVKGPERTEFLIRKWEELKGNETQSQ